MPQPDTYVANCSAPLAFAGSVLDNDVADDANSNLRVMVWGTPQNGTLTWSNRAGFFGYQPTPGFSGELCWRRGMSKVHRVRAKCDAATDGRQGWWAVASRGLQSKLAVNNSLGT